MDNDGYGSVCVREDWLSVCRVWLSCAFVSLGKEHVQQQDDCPRDFLSSQQRLLQVDRLLHTDKAAICNVALSQQAETPLAYRIRCTNERNYARLSWTS